MNYCPNCGTKLHDDLEDEFDSMPYWAIALTAFFNLAMILAFLFLVGLGIKDIITDKL